VKNEKLEAGAFRQGDCFLVRVDAMPEGLVDITPDCGRVVLMAGEATGHHHAFYDRGVKIFAPAGSPKGSRPIYLQVVKKTALLKHEEHSPASLPPGIYRMPTQVEHTDDDEPRVVED
jgi:hypothetical protein